MSKNNINLLYRESGFSEITSHILSSQFKYCKFYFMQIQVLHSTISMFCEHQLFVIILYNGSSQLSGKKSEVLKSARHGSRDFTCIWYNSSCFTRNLQHLYNVISNWPEQTAGCRSFPDMDRWWGGRWRRWKGQTESE